MEKEILSSCVPYTIILNMVDFEAFHWLSSSTNPEIERSENIIPVDRIEQFPHALETQLDKNDHGDIGIWG